MFYDPASSAGVAGAGAVATLATAAVAPATRERAPVKQHRPERPERPAAVAASAPTTQCEWAWEAQLHKLGAYKQRHGDCNVPEDWAEDRWLGQWVSMQRFEKRNLDRGKLSYGLTAERAATLTALGFVWAAAAPPPRIDGPLDGESRARKTKRNKTQKTWRDKMTKIWEKIHRDDPETYRLRRHTNSMSTDELKHNLINKFNCNKKILRRKKAELQILYILYDRATADPELHQECKLNWAKFHSIRLNLVRNRVGQAHAERYCALGSYLNFIGNFHWKFS